MKVLLIGLIFIGAAATAAIAGECPALQAQIDEQVARRFDRQASEARAMAKDAEALHKAGNHADSVKKYDEAAKAAGITLKKK